MMLAAVTVLLFYFFARNSPDAVLGLYSGGGKSGVKEALLFKPEHNVAPRLRGDMADYGNDDDDDDDDVNNNNIAHSDDDNSHSNRNKGTNNEDTNSDNDPNDNAKADDDGDGDRDGARTDNVDDEDKNGHGNDDHDDVDMEWNKGDDEENAAEDTIKERTGLRARAEGAENEAVDEKEEEEEDDADEDEPAYDKSAGQPTDPKINVEKVTPGPDSRSVSLGPDRHATRLLILAYMRTGSSMTGRILNYNPDIFYWYEPLHSLERYYVTGGKPESSYRNKTLNEWFKASAMAGGNVSAALSCDIQAVYRGTLTDYFLTYGRHGTKAFFSCFKEAETEERWRECSFNMSLACRTRFSATAVKLIRLHMARAREVMARDPKVKVVHLIRDPRAVLSSRRALGFADFGHLAEEASLLCGKYAEDLRLAPGEGDPLRPRYKMVRYEDIVDIPLEFTRSLYAFMGLPVPDIVLKEVQQEMAQAKRTKTCPACPPSPLNATEVAQAWRSKLDFKDVQVISQACGDTLKALGYRQTFDNENQLRDLSVSSVDKVPLR